MAEGTGLPAHLIAYWTTGAGGARIGWNTPGDFDRCRTLINAKVSEDGDKPLSDRVISGLCATLHKVATGHAPGKHGGE
jgi:hypothetical protein